MEWGKLSLTEQALIVYVLQNLWRVWSCIAGWRIIIIFARIQAVIGGEAHVNILWYVDGAVGGRGGGQGGGGHQRVRRQVFMLVRDIRAT